MPDKTFKKISNFISEFNVSSFNKEDMVIKYLKYFSIEKICSKLPEDNKDYSFSKIFDSYHMYILYYSFTISYLQLS